MKSISGWKMAKDDVVELAAELSGSWKLAPR